MNKIDLVINYHEHRSSYLIEVYTCAYCMIALCNISNNISNNNGDDNNKVSIWHNHNLKLT